MSAALPPPRAVAAAHATTGTQESPRDGSELCQKGVSSSIYGIMCTKFSHSVAKFFESRSEPNFEPTCCKVFLRSETRERAAAIVSSEQCAVCGAATKGGGLDAGGGEGGAGGGTTWGLHWEYVWVSDWHEYVVKRSAPSQHVVEPLYEAGESH